MVHQCRGELQPTNSRSPQRLKPQRQTHQHPIEILGMPLSAISHTETTQVLFQYSIEIFHTLRFYCPGTT